MRLSGYISTGCAQFEGILKIVNMARNPKAVGNADASLVEVKSKLDAEFRRFSVDKNKLNKCEDFYVLLETLHGVKDIPFNVCYTDPKDGDLLPINNDDNFQRALYIAKPLLRIILQRKGDAVDFLNGYGTIQKKKTVISKLISGEPRVKSHIPISMPEDFRRVSAIIDVDIIPETHRRVKLMKNGSDKPLGFYIRDGTSVRVTAHGLEKVPGIFISRLVPGGLAEGTGLLAVNDEVLEVNGIEVTGKTLDQVTDMMVANSSNLIITVKPVNQHNNIGPRGSSGRLSQKSTTSLQSGLSVNSGRSFDSDTMHDSREDDEDIVHDHLKEEIEKVTVSDKVDKTTADSKDKEDKDSAVVTL